MDGLSIALLGVAAFVVLLVWYVSTHKDNRHSDDKQAREKREKYAQGISSSEQITFHYCNADSAPGVTRRTVQRLAEQLGIDENQVIHQALYEFATKCSVLRKEA